MIVVIDGHRFETAKAKYHVELDWFNGNNRLTGDLYCSSGGTWYVYTPSQWSNGRRWELIDPTEALERYRSYLSTDDVEEIVELANLETE